MTRAGVGPARRSGELGCPGGRRAETRAGASALPVWAAAWPASSHHEQAHRCRPAARSQLSTRRRSAPPGRWPGPAWRPGSGADRHRQPGDLPRLGRVAVRGRCHRPHRRGVDGRPTRGASRRPLDGPFPVVRIWRNHRAWRRVGHAGARGLRSRATSAGDARAVPSARAGHHARRTALTATDRSARLELSRPPRPLRATAGAAGHRSFRQIGTVSHRPSTTRDGRR